MKELIKATQEKKFTEFEPRVKEILKQKVAERLQQQGFFARLDQAHGLAESEIILEGYKLKDFAGILDKMKVPYEIIKQTIKIPSSYWKEVDKAIKKTKNQFKQQDDMDSITIRLK